MITATNGLKNELLITSGETTIEVSDFYENVKHLTGEISEERLLFEVGGVADFKRVPFCIVFDSDTEMNDFISNNNINVVSNKMAVIIQNAMLENDKDIEDSEKTVAELFGISDYDPWDKRTDEQKEKALKNENSLKKRDKKRQDGLSGDSFGGGIQDDGDDDDIQIRDIKWHIDPDTGEVVIDNVLVDKGLINHNEHYYLKIDEFGNDVGRYSEWFASKRIGIFSKVPIVQAPDGEGVIVVVSNLQTEKIRHTIPVGSRYEKILSTDVKDADPDFVIADDDMVKVYYRLDIKNTDYDQIMAVIATSSKTPFKTKFVNGFGTWLAYVTRINAEETFDLLTANNIKPLLVEVNKNGERLIEEGVDAYIIDTKAPFSEPPMPWNDRSADFFELSSDDQKKAVTGDLFYFCISDYGSRAGRVVHITPRSYFEKHGRIWEGDWTVYQHLLPDTLDKMDDIVGGFNSYGWDLKYLRLYLTQTAKITDNLFLQAYVNTLPSANQANVDSDFSGETGSDPRRETPIVDFPWIAEEKRIQRENMIGTSIQDDDDDDDYNEHMNNLLEELGDNIGSVENPWIYSIVGDTMSVNTLHFWNNNNCIPDFHMAPILKRFFDIDDEIYRSEENENMFVMNKTETEISTMMNSYGFIRNLDMQDFLGNNG